MSPLGKMKQTLLWASFHILCHTEILSHQEAVRFLCTSAQEKTALGPEPYWHGFAATAFRASTPASVLPACHFWTAIPRADDVEAGEGTAGIA